MADRLVEHQCRKCGSIFIDLESDPIHHQNIDAGGNDLGDCGGEGEAVFVFSENFTNRGQVKS